MKTYVKPDLYYEGFELSHSVASGCGTSLNHSQEGCTIDGVNYGLDFGETVFNIPAGKVSACSVDNDVIGLEIDCQQTGNDGIFTS